MAGDSNHRSSFWWKLKKPNDSGEADSHEEDEQSAAKHIDPANNNSLFNVNNNNSGITLDNPNLKGLRDRFNQHYNDNFEGNGIFGVELEKSLKLAAAKIFVSGNELAYGEVPIVVAKCGSFLKHNGLSVEGIFRVGGSSKRVKELQRIFSEPPLYGKDLDWTGYTVHDAASLLRRFLNSLPEPVIPLELYETFREPIRSRSIILTYFAHRNTPAPSNTTVATTSSNNKQITTETMKSITNTANNSNNDELVKKNYIRKPVPNTAENENHEVPSEPTFNEPLEEENELRNKELDKKRRHRNKKYKKFVKDIDAASAEYQKLVSELPILRKILLLYILDLLESFSQHSEENRMSKANLSAVFQPSILSHPKHDMCPDEYILSQKVVEYLVEYSYKLLPLLTKAVNSSENIAYNKEKKEQQAAVATAEATVLPTTTIKSSRPTTSESRNTPNEQTPVATSV